MGHPSFEMMEGDIRDPEVCVNAVEGMDYVTHQAALGSVPRSINDPLRTNDVNISGFGSFEGEDLQSQTASINISGAGSATIWVEDELDANISGAGSINYYGSASVTKNVSGVGSVNREGNK